MKRNWKDVALGMAVAGVIGSVALPASAAAVTKQISATYSGIQIVVDGVKVTPKDANGKTVEPFIFEGTTYLPVRAMGEAVGKQVTWDGASQTVYLGKAPGATQELTDVCPPYDKTGVDVYEGDPKSSFEIMGQKYVKGLKFDDRLRSHALCNLNGQYNSLSFDAGHVDKTGGDGHPKMLYIYADGQVIKELTLDSQGPIQHVDLNVSGVLQLKFEVVGDSSGYGASGKYALFNMILN